MKTQTSKKEKKKKKKKTEKQTSSPRVEIDVNDVKYHPITNKSNE